MAPGSATGIADALADDGGARHLKVGQVLPSVALRSTNGHSVDVSALAGWSVLYCYSWTGRPGVANPANWDDIPGAHGSTPETEGFRDLHPGFSAKGVRVLGVSTQTSDWQRELVTRLHVPFDILSDASLELAQALGLPTFETGGQTYLKRLSLLLNDSRIVRVFYPVSLPAAHPREVLGQVAILLGD